MPNSGHRAVPHPADVTIEAWGPTCEACLGEAISALVDSFADLSRAQPVDTVVVDLPAGDAADRLVTALDHVIYLLDTQGLIPLATSVDIGPATLRLTMSVARIDSVELIGAAPKAVSLSGLECTQLGGQWRCRVTIDV
ncbi:archease [Mycobacterium botniense]|uniref:Archease domain-containing protein n=1 Tax=Mycobacterium botniense TaxID=84962 RepID=A0A7I9XZ18_9MYCO|nr:archease [Mycobacterium botniense]GFG74973.1 hypothetical protein MBOT_23380 [Mycobacterium botniense]